MDEMKINTSFSRGILQKIVEKAIKKKCGYEVEVHFPDPISVNYYEDDCLYVEVKTVIGIQKKDLDDIIHKIL